MKNPIHTKPAKSFEPADFNSTESRIRSVGLNICLVIGMMLTTYYGVIDKLNGQLHALSFSLMTISCFFLTLLINIFIPRMRKIVHLVFVTLISVIFLALLITQFPTPAIIFWCFTLPLVAMFLLGRMYGTITIIIFNISIILVFYLDIHLLYGHYTYDFAVRYCTVIIFISIMSYYYETLRDRSIAFVNTVNQTLEQRIQERTQALEENQERLRQVEKLEAIGLLAGGVAHDFNNQLTGIMAFADLIRLTAKNAPEMVESAEQILSGAKRAADLTGQLLAFARKGNLLTLPVNIHNVIADVISLLEHTLDKQIILRQELASENAIILGDPGQLQNALLNLALNARDAMPNGGELCFSTQTVNFDKEKCQSIHSEIAPGPYIRVCVADNGNGIEKEIQHRIFEPFFTTKGHGKGTGMGLAAVYGTVRSLKGAITVQSKPGQGTSFDLYFPLLAMDELPSVPAEEPVSSGKSHGHILLVDDERAVSESINKLLRFLGYTVTVFQNGKDAVAYYKENWHAVDLVILDMIMPGMSGKDTFIAMQQVNPEIIALLASGYSLSGEAQSILDIGVKGFIQKPFTITAVRDKISSLLNMPT